MIRGWPRLLLLTLILAAAVALHWSTAAQLHELWLDTDNTTYTHGYLIAAISLWLLWQRRADIVSANIDPKPLAVAALLGAELVWLFATQAAIQIAGMMMLPVILWLVVLSVFGRDMARRCAFPLTFLYFAVPLWGSFNPLAQWSTVFAVRAMLSAVGIDAFFEANLVHLKSGSFEIAGGCSGLHFIMVGLSLAALVGELRRDTLRMRLKLAGMALLLAVLSNWVRVFVIIVAGDLTHMQHYLVRVSHYGFGWCVFAVAMAVFFLIESRMKSGPQPEASFAMPADRPAVVGAPGRAALIWLATALCAALPAAANAIIISRQQMLFVVLPVHVGEWSASNIASSSDWNPVFKGSDAEQRGVYIVNGDSLEVYSAGYALQTQGKKLGGYYNSVFGALESTGVADLRIAGGRLYNVAEARAYDGRTSTLWYGYRVGERWFTSPVRAQLWYAVRAITQLRPLVSRVFVVRARCASDCMAANRAVTGFVERWP